jgi:hypothetical protein
MVQNTKMKFTEKPKPEDFGITPEDFESYRSRFQFEYLELLFTYGPPIVCPFLAISEKTSIGKISLFVIGLIAGICSHFLFKTVNEKLSKKHPQYYKVKKFQLALGVYYKDRKEKFESKLNAKLEHESKDLIPKKSNKIKENTKPILLIFCTFF